MRLKCLGLRRGFMSIMRRHMWGRLIGWKGKLRGWGVRGLGLSGECLEE